MIGVGFGFDFGFGFGDETMLMVMEENGIERTIGECRRLITSDRKESKKRMA